MRSLQLTAYVCALILISGCSAVGVVYSSNPYNKLANASSLLEHDRATAAEHLIVEALAICEETAEPACFAAVYRGYGMFFADPSLMGQWRPHFAEHGFIEATASLSNRYEKAVEYLEKSRDLYNQLSRYDALSNVYLQMGFIHEGTYNRDSACAAYDASLQAHIENRRQNPNARVILPKRYDSFEDYITVQKGKAQCEDQGS
ncbi:hypothetical protein FXF61_07695 [Pseudomonas sp. C27(2019)]|uniref:hypothetical protein n=1 Tax=Pseudomonas sp. C27(2019) TaxID=2604941 RepID=UPI00124450D9|nr:hypothetical protein [Pseudomonas sp. C27(2019)]QEY59064.1 hypothetical protein FXF61_07695 [Pseudomonas sp. C27(2019)]